MKFFFRSGAGNVWNSSLGWFFGFLGFVAVFRLIYSKKTCQVVFFGWGVSAWVSLMCVQGVPKNDPTCFCQNFVKSAPELIIFWHTDSQDDRIM